MWRFLTSRPIWVRARPRSSGWSPGSGRRSAVGSSPADGSATCRRRRMYALGLAVFAAASLACGVAPSPGTLIVQGLAAALLAPQVHGCRRRRAAHPRVHRPRAGARPRRRVRAAHRRCADPGRRARQRVARHLPDQRPGRRGDAGAGPPDGPVPGRHAEHPPGRRRNRPGHARPRRARPAAAGSAGRRGRGGRSRQRPSCRPRSRCISGTSAGAVAHRWSRPRCSASPRSGSAAASPSSTRRPWRPSSSTSSRDAGSAPWSRACCSSPWAPATSPRPPGPRPSPPGWDGRSSRSAR